MTRRDAETLLREKRGIRQAMMSAGGGTVEPELSTLAVLGGYALDVGRFLPMFDVPMQYGRAWNSSDDDNRSRVVVLSKAINDKLFQGADSTGREIRLSGHSLRVIGVMKKWNPEPHFFDLTTGNYGKDEDLLVPFSTAMDLEFGSNGNMNCFGENPDGSSNSINAPCSWIQYWVELDPAKVEDYRSYLANYSDQQRAAGRFERPTNVRLRPVMEWLTFKNAVPSDVRLQMWLALGFSASAWSTRWACCWRSSCAAAARSACAARSVPAVGKIFLQCLAGSRCVGVAGGVLGIGLALLGLYAVRQQPVDYASLAHLDGSMLLLASLTLFASLAAGSCPPGARCRLPRPSSSSRSSTSTRTSHGYPPHPQHPAPAQDSRRPDRAGSRPDLRHRLQCPVPGHPAR
jgi:putative ABC transport system permease protein